MSWNFDGDCIESVDCFWQDSHFYNVYPANPWAWEIFLSSEIFFNFFLQRFEVLIIQIFHFLVRFTPRYFILFVTIEKGVVSLISFSACLFFVYRNATDLFELILYPATSLKLVIRFRSSLVEFLGSLIYTLSYHLQKVIFWFLPFQFVFSWFPFVVELLWLGLQVQCWIGREKVGSLV